MLSNQEKKNMGLLKHDDFEIILSDLETEDLELDNTPPTTKLKFLSEGTYGKVYSSPSGMAVKKQSMNSIGMKEYSFFSYLNHPNIIKCTDLKLFESTMSFQMEKGISDLWNCENLDLTLVTTIIHQILQGVEHMHTMGVLHRDLKPNNVLLFPNNKIKIIDMGMATLVGKDIVRGCTHTCSVQSLSYRAPEVAQQRSYGPPSDIWSVGCILLYLLQKNGDYDSMTQNYFEQIQDIYKDNDDVSEQEEDSMFVHRFYSYILDVPPSDSDMFSEETELYKKKWIRKKEPELPNMVRADKEHPLIDLIFKLLAWDPKDRLTARQALQHPALNKIGLGKLTKKKSLTKEWEWGPEFINIQEDVNLKMHTILNDWLYEICRKWKLPNQVLVASFRVIQEFLSVKKISRMILQRVGMAAVFLVNNLYSKYPVYITDFVYMSDNSSTKAQIEEMSIDMLNIMDIYSLTRDIFCASSVDNEEKRWKALVYEISMTHEDSKPFNTSKILKGKWENMATIFNYRKSKYFKSLIPEYTEKTNQIKIEILRLKTSKDKDNNS
jgi:serine/threonine protein kinase